MNKIELLEKQIAEERASVSKRLEELRASNVTDLELLETYVERFAHAVQDGAGEKELAKLEADRNEANRRYEQSSEIIRILSSEDGSKLRRLNAELAVEHLKEIEVLELKADKLNEKLKPLHEGLVDGIHQLYELSQVIREHKKNISKTRLDPADKERLGLEDTFNFFNHHHKSKVPSIPRSFKLPTFATIKHSREGRR